MRKALDILLCYNINCVRILNVLCVRFQTFLYYIPKITKSLFDGYIERWLMVTCSRKNNTCVKRKRILLFIICYKAKNKNK